MRFLTLICLLAVAVLTARSETAGEPAARANALEVAGAFSNAGYKIRDGHYAAVLAPKGSVIVLVNLYAGNDYYLSVGFADEKARGTIDVFDEKGKPIEGDRYADGAKLAFGFSPAASGPYYVRVRHTEGPESAFCLLYSYK